MTLYETMAAALATPGFEAMNITRDEVGQLLACMNALAGLNAIAEDESTYEAWMEEFDATEDALRAVGIEA